MPHVSAVIFVLGTHDRHCTLDAKVRFCVRWTSNPINADLR